MNAWIRNFVLLVLMLAASAGAVVLRPTHKLAEHRPQLNLSEIVPRSFGDWREEDHPSAQIVDPQQQEKINRIYSETVVRTYVNGDGYRIMLSIAYGTNQEDEMQVHKPEICYPAQGFVLQDRRTGRLALSNGSLPVTRILTTQGQRGEPVTYWITVGDQVVGSDLQKKRAEIRHALRREIPDGMLVRFSSIDTDSERAYAIQREFAAQMTGAISPESQPRFIGNNDQN